MDQTVRRLTPRELYRFLPTATNRVVIERPGAAPIMKTEAQLRTLLQDPDLHHHLREMYEAALESLQ